MAFPLRTSHVAAGFLAILVGYTGSIAIVFQAAESAGATPAQLNSWLLVLGLGMGLFSLGLSWWYRTPVLAAWSTPGAAMLISNLVGLTMAEAVGAFLICGLLILITGLSGIFDRLARIIPGALAAALLAGILLRFGIDAFAQLQQSPLLVGSMLISFFIGLRFSSRYAVLLALCVGSMVAAFMGLFDTRGIQLVFASPVWTTPSFTLKALIGVAIPLYFITMASQNVPGVAVLRSAGYQTPVSPLISWSGVITTIGAPFGLFAINLAAITAAICIGEEAGEDPKQRYLAAMSAGVFYLLAAVFGATIVTLLVASPEALVLSIAGIALFTTINNSLSTAFQEPDHRIAAGVTFLVSASGISFAGIGSAFWALVAGLLVWAISRGRS